MGTFETFENAVNPTAPFELADSCTACQGEGYIAFPLNVTIGLDDYDPCPFGCEVPSETDGYYTEHEPEVALEPDLHDAYLMSLRKVPQIDRFLILEQVMRLRGIKPLSEIQPNRDTKRVSSDYPIMGLLEAESNLVVPCTTPPYLVGAPIEFDLPSGMVRVRYEFMGSYAVVRYAKSEAAFLRFAYPWDNDFSTSLALG